MNINKDTNIFIDIDDTIYKSLERFLLLRHNIYSDTKIEIDDITDYNFNNHPILCEDTKRNKEVFHMPCFYINEAKYFYQYTIDTIKYLSNIYNIVFITKGDIVNCEYKQQLLSKILPNIEYKFIRIPLEDKDKSSIDMSNGIFIDDLPINLQNSNAKHKILFSGYGELREWQKCYDKNTITLCQNWKEIRTAIIDTSIIV